MDEVTQQNAALVEEAAAAAESLQGQASNLAQVVSAFKLDDRQAVVVAVRARSGVPFLIRKVPAARTVIDSAKLGMVSNVKSVRCDQWEQFY